MSYLLMELFKMNDDEAIDIIISRMQHNCCAITANMVITLIKKQREEIKLVNEQMSKVHKMYLQLKRKLL